VCSSELVAVCCWLRDGMWPKTEIDVVCPPSDNLVSCCEELLVE
jgi:hypothetical protein